MTPADEVRWLAAAKNAVAALAQGHGIKRAETFPAEFHRRGGDFLRHLGRTGFIKVTGGGAGAAWFAIEKEKLWLMLDDPELFHSHAFFSFVAINKRVSAVEQPAPASGSAPTFEEMLLANIEWFRTMLIRIEARVERLEVMWAPGGSK